MVETIYNPKLNISRKLLRVKNNVNLYQYKNFQTETLPKFQKIPIPDIKLVTSEQKITNESYGCFISTKQIQCS